MLLSTDEIYRLLRNGGPVLDDPKHSSNPFVGRVHDAAFLRLATDEIHALLGVKQTAAEGQEKDVTLFLERQSQR
jgi:hypothetical protein